MNNIAVVLVGHTLEKIQHLKTLYQINKPDMEHDLVVIYNGTKEYKEANCTILNNNTLRDIGMYWYAINLYHTNKYFFMNDDVVFIKDNLWLEEANKKLDTCDIVGVQSNLSSLFSADIIKKVTKGHYPEKWVEWGQTPQFIRTSNFACTKKYFIKLFNKYKTAQSFEKNTIKETLQWSLFDDKFHIYDSNLLKYKGYINASTEHPQ